MAKKVINATEDVTKLIESEPTTPSIEERKGILLEEKKIKALEKIANSLDALTVWFEEIDKDEWGPRIEHYLYQWHKAYIETKSDKLED
jgi:hypothetical protein